MGTKMSTIGGHGILKIKAIDEEKRVIRGIASTPTPDRANDVIDPLGMVFRTLPKLLLNHNSNLPVGEVTYLKATKNGVEFEASIPKVGEAGTVKDRVDAAWHSLKYNLISAVSVGFKIIESEVQKNGVFLIKSWELFELSLVPVPANPEAVITGIKSIDAEIRASMGGKDEAKKTASDVSEKKDKTKSVKIHKQGELKMSIQEKLKGFKAELEAKSKAMNEMMEKSLESGETFDAADQEKFDTLETEVSELKKHIEKAERLQANQIATAKAVTHEAGSDDKEAAKVRTGVQVKKVDNEKDGIPFARLARVKALAFTGQVGTRDELEIARRVYPHDEKLANSIKAIAVDAASTLSSTWAGNLINEGNVQFADFVEYLRPRTLYGQIAPRFKRIPFDVPVAIQSTAGAAKWVKEGMAKPVTEWQYTRTKLTPLKVAAIAAATKEMLMRSSASVDMLIRDELAKCVGARIDSTLFSNDPAVADESPAGLLYGVSPTSLTGGSTVNGIACDIKTLITTFLAANKTLSGAFFVMPETVATSLALAKTDLGADAFPGMSPTGGTLAGIPVYTSEYVPGGDSTGAVVALVKGDDIYLGDDGGLQVSISDQASLQMDHEPTQNSTGAGPTATSVVSMFQTNSVAFLVERFLNYKKRRNTAVVFGFADWDVCDLS